MTVLRRIIPLIALLTLASACGSDSTSTAPTTSSAPYSQIDLVVGTGATANAGTTATVGYTGYLYDSSKAGGKGTAFQSGNFSFVVGVGQAIKGFDQGIVGMRVGGQRRLTIPPELAYGANPPANSGIPVNATLVFEITLISVQ